MKTFEKELPQGYKEVAHFNAAEKKTGLKMTLYSFIVMIVVFFILYFIVGKDYFEYADLSSPKYLLTLDVIFLVMMLAYIVLHEIVHGIAYKCLTKQKLTFGLKWSCAYCGVPDIYTYRKTALISTTAPLIVFSIIFIVAIIICAIVKTAYIYVFIFMMSMHLSGCVGDIYMAYLLLKKYKDPTTLMRDTGPEQWIYQKED